jgi:8-oxo-dGTP diphosphatase
LAGCWEFPGGKCHAGETLAACIVREIEEELGVDVAAPEFLVTIDHTYPEKTIRLHFLRCRWPAAAAPHARDGQEFGWFSLPELRQLELAPADRRFVGWLESHATSLGGKA